MNRSRTWCVHCDCPFARCAEEIAELRAEIARLTPVIDAAVAYRTEWDYLTEAELFDAVDALTKPVQPDRPTDR